MKNISEKIIVKLEILLNIKKGMGMENGNNTSTMLYLMSVGQDVDFAMGLEDHIKDVPTCSNRKRTIIKLLNEIVEENPACLNTIYALLTYSTQKWAMETRAHLKLDEKRSEQLEESLNESLNALQDILVRTGIRPRMKDCRIMRIHESDRIINCLEAAVEWLSSTPMIGDSLAYAVKAAHFPGSYEISSHCFKKYYKVGVMYIHEKFGAQIDQLVMELTSCQWLYSADTSNTAYHNTLLLIKIYPFLIHRFKRRGNDESLSDLGVQRDANGLFLLNTLEAAVNDIKNYHPSADSQMYQILKGMMEDKSDIELSKNLGISTSSLYITKKKAVTLLSFVLWGYSTMQILEGMVFAPVSKKERRQIAKKQ